MKKKNIPFLLPACTAFVVTASIMPFAARAAEPVPVVRSDDAAMTCPALAAQIDALRQASAATVKPKKRGFGFLKMVGAIVPGVGMLNGVAGGLVSSAAAAGSAVAQTSAKDMAVVDAATVSRAAADEERRARLIAISYDKHC